MTDPTVEAVALAIGHSMASFASGNNMPDMSGDPRNRIPKALRHSFDRAVGYAAQAAIAAHDSALKAEGMELAARVVEQGHCVNGSIIERAAVAAYAAAAAAKIRADIERIKGGDEV